MKIIKLILLLVLVSTFCTACTDAVEIDDEVYALAIGVDKGANNSIRVTVQCPTYKGGGSSGEKDESGQVDGTIVTSVEAAGIMEFMNLLNTAIPRRLSLMHSKMIVFSEELAREGVEKYIAPMTRFRETRRTMRVVVCDGKAEEFLKENKSIFGESTAKDLEIMFKQAGVNDYFPDVKLHDFYTNLVSPYQQPYAIYSGINTFKNLPDEVPKEKQPRIMEPDIKPGNIPRKGASKREFFGTAIFKEGTMVGQLNAYETRSFQMVTGKFNTGVFLFDDMNLPGYNISVSLKAGRKPKVKAHFENGIPVIDVKVNLEGDVNAIQSRINYESLDKIGELNNQLEKYFKDSIVKVVEKTQQNWNSDVFGFGDKVAGCFSTIEEWEAYKWLDHYREAKVNVEVEANVRRTGMLIRSTPVSGQ